MPYFGLSSHIVVFYFGRNGRNSRSWKNSEEVGREEKNFFFWEKKVNIIEEVGRNEKCCITYPD